VLCSEITAHFRGLSSQWVTAIKALCNSTGATSNGYVELLDEIDVSCFLIHGFVESRILIGRRTVRKIARDVLVIFCHVYGFCISYQVRDYVFKLLVKLANVLGRNNITLR
jgi:hypothetical protein